ncbi:MAG: transposase, partial [Clostridiaceae bacterium]
MSELSKEVLRNYIKEQNFTNADEVLSAMKEMFRDVLQEALESEMDTQLGYDRYDVSEKQTENSRNGYSKKTIKSELGTVELSIPRDRNGEFEPKIVPKHQRNVTGIEDKVMALYAAGMTTRDISEQVKNLYDIEISAEMVS